MDPVLHALLIERLHDSGLTPAAARLVEAACEARGGPSPPPEPVWLKSVSVEGFRGIGACAALELAPRPGLTVVAGRNGSGKSSFAEGLELLMTGALKRVAKRPKAWTDGWQCLHHDAPTRLAAELVCGGEVVPLTREWPRGLRFDDASAPPHRWSAALDSYRPFLSYAELATMFATLTSLYDALSQVLGLGALDEVTARLGARRLALERRARAAKSLEVTLFYRLDPQDPDQAALHAAIRGRRPDFRTIQALLDAPVANADATAPTDPGPAAPTKRDAANGATTPTDRDAGNGATAPADRDATSAVAADHAPTTGGADRDAAARAALLRHAVACRDGDACPVCGAADRSWRVRAEEALDDLEPEAAWKESTPWVPQTSWREDAAAWLAAARGVAGESAELNALKAAESWLKGVAGGLRAQRFAPIAERAIANWRELRQGSSVDVHEIALRRIGRGGRADFGVRVDGEEANALSVMSQGELLALSVSVFLPRAALDESPFRFAVIDDPVQTLDAAKVDGLARILHRAAATRQIVVFTHDDRLTHAFRRLRLDATVLRVERHPRSRVAIHHDLEAVAA